MSSKKRLVSIAFTAIVGASGATAVQAESVVVQTGGEVFENIAITPTAIDFGQFTASATSGTISIGADGSAVGTGGATLISGGIAGGVSITGQDGSTVSLAIKTVTPLSGPGQDMILGQVQFSDGAIALGETPDVTLVNGTANLSLAGELTVNALQTPGLYSGTVSIDVTYV